MTRACALAAAVSVVALSVAALSLPACRRAAEAGGPRTLDAFDDLTPSRATGSDGVTSAIHAAPGVRGGAMRLTFVLSRSGDPRPP